ncbi:hypothetical protein V2J09_020010 [Rumex salicifolius]
MNHALRPFPVKKLDFCTVTNHIPTRVTGSSTVTLQILNHHWRSRHVQSSLRLLKSAAMSVHAPPSALPLIPEAQLNHGGVSIPLIGLGTASDPPVTPEATKAAVLEATRLGFRHFDTAFKYGSEQPIGDAVREAVAGGLISSREEIFITSKLWVGDAHPELVAPALGNTLRNLKIDYIDLYLVHWPVSSKPGKYDFPVAKEDFLPFDFAGVWGAMEECQKLGLAKAIGVSNFSCKKLGQILSIAKIPPAVNQVEVNPFWQQKKLIDFCKENEILVTAYSPLGAIGTFYGSNRVLECQILKDIADAKGKTIPQVCLRWAYEQGIAVVVKSFNTDRMKQNIDIFNWELSPEDHEMIRQIPQSRGVTGWPYISSIGPIKTLSELWDEIYGDEEGGGGGSGGGVFPVALHCASHMAGDSGSPITVTFSSSGRVVKRKSSRSDVRYSGSGESGLVSGRKRAIKNRLETGNDSLDDRNRRKSKRHKRESSKASWSTSDSNDSCLDKGDLRYKILQKNMSRESKEMDLDLRDRLSRRPNLSLADSRSRSFETTHDLRKNMLDSRDSRQSIVEHRTCDGDKQITHESRDAYVHAKQSGHEFEDDYADGRKIIQQPGNAHDHGRQIMLDPIDSCHYRKHCEPDPRESYDFGRRDRLGLAPSRSASNFTRVDMVRNPPSWAFEDPRQRSPARSLCSSVPTAYFPERSIAERHNVSLISPYGDDNSNLYKSDDVSSPPRAAGPGTFMMHPSSHAVSSLHATRPMPFVEQYPQTIGYAPKIPYIVCIQKYF